MQIYYNSISVNLYTARSWTASCTSNNLSQFLIFKKKTISFLEGAGCANLSQLLGSWSLIRPEAKCRTCPLRKAQILKATSTTSYYKFMSMVKLMIHDVWFLMVTAFRLAGEVERNKGDAETSRPGSTDEWMLFLGQHVTCVVPRLLHGVDAPHRQAAFVAFPCTIYASDAAIHYQVGPTTRKPELPAGVRNPRCLDRFDLKISTSHLSSHPPLPGKVSIEEKQQFGIDCRKFNEVHAVFTLKHSLIVLDSFFLYNAHFEGFVLDTNMVYPGWKGSSGVYCIARSQHWAWQHGGPPAKCLVHIS